MEGRNITNSGKPKKFYREDREDFQKFFSLTPPTSAGVTDVINLGSPVFNGKNLLKHEGHEGNEGKVRKIKALFSLVSLREAPCGLCSLCLGSFPRIAGEP